ncbi:streptogrisin D/glutamyl endopeptidase II [Streptomyces sp. SLBN-118]|uniref:S1 family peptidase n=1 Tax=Streptomyces sp. SLBN-118 TaxID=2768454 RepID=UPI0011537B34|nr:S1 family peptidase [Streptomyces sp. SLBN-118]TQK50785.1 streptogrisin D/glutamyl endopeptidase II [Streptomyces sp. SLBN-118]
MRRTLRARIFLSVLISLPAVGLGSGTAGAASEPTPGVTASASQYAVNTNLERELDDDNSAGSYLDPATGELVVTVTDSAAAEAVTAAGARPKLVERSTAQLKTVMNTLDTQANITGTSWGIDPSRNQVAVEADASVSVASMTQLRKVAAGLGEAVRVQRVPGVFKKEVDGGDAIYGGGYRCSAAFNVAGGGTARYFLTAGHCTNQAYRWAAWPGGPSIGTRVGTSFPTNDYGIVRYSASGQPYGRVDLYNGSYQDIASSADAIVGQYIRKSGSTTHVTTGRVTAVNVTVHYPEGTVYQMVRTTACSAAGDSGGAHFAGNVALGIHSGSAGCSGTNGSAIFQPVREALSAYGVHVY